MEKQASLFKNASTKEQKDKKAPLSPIDQAYQVLAIHHDVNTLHLFKGSKVSDILFWYAVNGDVYTETAEKFCKLSKKIKPNAYYHVQFNGEHVILHRYNTWILQMIDKSLNRTK